MSWKIRKTVGSCNVCQRKFSDEEKHYSLLQIQGEQLGREDRCIECWQKNLAPQDAIYWKSQFFLSPQKKRAIDFDGLREAFLQLTEKCEPTQESLFYLITLLLVRKKILKIREFKRVQDRECLVVAFSRARELHQVPVPDLSPEKLEPLKRELKAFFGDTENADPVHAAPAN